MVLCRAEGLGECGNVGRVNLETVGKFDVVSGGGHFYVLWAWAPGISPARAARGFCVVGYIIKRSLKDIQAYFSYFFRIVLHGVFSRL